MFTKQHYQRIAEVLGKKYNELYQTPSGDLVVQIIGDFSTMFEEDSPEFSKERFAKACVGVMKYEQGSS